MEFAKAKILVVEDATEVLAYFKGSLGRKFNADIQTAKDGPEALKVLSVEDFDLVIMDINMPGMSGIEVMQALEKVKKLPDIIVVTAHDSPEIARAVVEAGAVDYVVKPLDMEKMLSKAKLILSKKGLFVEK